MHQSTTVFARTPHQSKIYTKSNRSRFRRIFVELNSMQTLAIYRRLLLKTTIARIQPQRNRTRLGSRDVFSASHGILARAGARAAAKRENTRIGQAAADPR